jgi:hypothetical protein
MEKWPGKPQAIRAFAVTASRGGKVYQDKIFNRKIDARIYIDNFPELAQSGAWIEWVEWDNATKKWRIVK